MADELDQAGEAQADTASAGPGMPSWHRGRGRPTKYTPETVAAILDALEKGHGPTFAAKLANVDYATMREWANDPAKADFADALKKAQARGEQVTRDECLQTIRKAAAGYKIGDEIVRPVWQAAAWYLERKHREEYGRFEHVAVDANVQSTRRELFDQVVGAVDDETRAALVEIAAGIRAGQLDREDPVQLDRERRDDPAGPEVQGQA